MSILPTYLTMIGIGTHYTLVVRIFRLLRVFRVFKLVRFNREAASLANALRTSLYKISIFFMFILSIVILLGTLMYVVMIAAAYSADHDLPSASQRLRSAWIGASDPFQEYLAFTDEAILEGGNEADMRHLARLATDLGLSSPALAPYLIDDYHF